MRTMSSFDKNKAVKYHFLKSQTFRTSHKIMRKTALNLRRTMKKKIDLRESSETGF